MNRIITNYNINALFRREYGNEAAAGSREASSLFAQMMRNGESFDTSEASSKKSQENQSMEDYQKEIYQRICRLPINPFNGNRQISIWISDQAFERMKSDADYEQEVMQMLELTMGQPVGGQGYIDIEVGGTMEETRISMLNTNEDDSNRSHEKTFWEKRMERFQEIQAELQEKWKKDHLMEKMVQEKIRIEQIRDDKLAQRVAAPVRYDAEGNPIIEPVESVYMAGPTAAELFAGLI